MQTTQVIEKIWNGYHYYMCKTCLLISLDRNFISSHVDDKYGICKCKKHRLQITCFGCNNIFFSKHSLLSHIIYDHQINEKNASLLLEKISNDSDEFQGNNKQSDIGIASDISIIPRKSLLNEELQDLSKLQHYDTIANVNSDNRRDGIIISNYMNSIPQKSLMKDDSQNLSECRFHDNTSNVDSNNKKTVLEPKEIIESTNSKRKSKKNVENKTLGYRCSIDNCTVRLLAQENISYHQKCHNQQKQNDEENFKCPECLEFTSKYWRNLAAHLWRSHIVDMELYACDSCNFKTPSLSKLINQHRGIHGNDRPFVCEFCGRAFKTTKQLRTHRTFHNINNQETVECEACQRIFKSFRKLKLHNNSVHEGNKPFKCNVCSYSASTSSGLKLHLRRHTGEKPFSCDQCSYSTGDHNSFRRHKLKHLGLKPYNCPHCSYACIQSSTYKVHLKNKHPGLEHGLMFSCEHCAYKSLSKGNFLTHMAKHGKTEKFKSQSAISILPASSKN